MIPNDPVMLLSYVNTQLRDQGIDAAEITEKLRSIDYEYDETCNRFV